MSIDRPLATAGMLFAGVLLMFFVVTPVYKQFNILQLNLAEKKAEFNAKYEYYADIAKKYDDLQGRKDEVAKVDDALPENADFGQLMYYLQQKANDSGLLLRNIVLSQSAKAGEQKQVKDISFSLQCFGNYAALKNFVTTLERSSRIFEVSSISFGSAAQQATPLTGAQLQSQNAFNFSLQIKTHSY